MKAQTRFFTKFLLLVTVFLLNFSASSFAQSHEEGSKAASDKFDFQGVMMHHLLDNNAWDFDNLGKIELPRILYHSTTGLKVYGSTTAAEADGWIPTHELDHEARHGMLLAPSARELVEKAEAGQATSNKKELAKEISTYKPYDLSITRNVLYMMFTAVILLLIFVGVARGYTKNIGKAPKGVQSFFEPIVVYIRDEVAIPNIGAGYERYMPLLLTMFFFIWFLNLLGMTPFSANVTGNIAVTLSLSAISLLIITFSANKHYWGHIVNPPVPFFVKLILVPVELMGILTKPFALMMRLFANITAGHVMMLALLSLIFVFGEMGKSAVGGYGAGLISTLFIVAISLLELFVAILQAYVFTMLTAVFIGQATEIPEHHH